MRLCVGGCCCFVMPWRSWGQNVIKSPMWSWISWGRFCVHGRGTIRFGTLARTQEIMPLFLAKASGEFCYCQLQALKILKLGAKIEWYWLRYHEDFFFSFQQKSFSFSFRFLFPEGAFLYFFPPQGVLAASLLFAWNLGCLLRYHDSRNWGFRENRRGDVLGLTQRGQTSVGGHTTGHGWPPCYVMYLARDEIRGAAVGRERVLPGQPEVQRARWTKHSCCGGQSVLMRWILDHSYLHLLW